MSGSSELAGANAAMWRGALKPALAIALLSIVIATSFRGVRGMWGALLASFIVVIFFSTSLLVARLTKSADPISTMALAMFSYFTKLLIIAGFLILVTKVTSPATVDRSSFGVSAIAVALAWLAGEVRAFFSLRLQLPLPERSVTSPEGDGKKDG
jgi:ATP synthase protein I